jgi:hypothetical protein
MADDDEVLAPQAERLRRWLSALADEKWLLTRTRAVLKYWTHFADVIKDHAPQYGVFYTYEHHHDDAALPSASGMPLHLFKTSVRHAGRFYVIPEAVVQREIDDIEAEMDRVHAQLVALHALASRIKTDEELYRPGGAGHRRLALQYRHGLRRLGDWT